MEKRYNEFSVSLDTPPEDMDLQTSLSEIIKGIPPIDEDTEETKKFLTDRVARISADLLINHTRLWGELEPNGRNFIIGVRTLNYEGVKRTLLSLEVYRTMVTEPFCNLIGCEPDSAEDITYLYNAIMAIEKDLK